MRSGHDVNSLITTNWYDPPHMAHLEPHATADLQKRLAYQASQENALARLVRRHLGRGSQG